MYGQQNPYAQYPYTGYSYPNYGNRQFMQPQQSQAQKQEVAPQVDYSKFVTVEQLNGLPTAEQYQELVAQYTFLLDQVNTMKKIMTSVNSPKSNEKVPIKGNTQANV